MAERCQDNVLAIWQQRGVIWKDSKKFIKEYVTAVTMTAVLGYLVEEESNISISDPS